MRIELGTCRGNLVKIRGNLSRILQHRINRAISKHTDHQGSIRIKVERECGQAYVVNSFPDFLTELGDETLVDVLDRIESESIETGFFKDPDSPFDHLFTDIGVTAKA